MVVVIAATAADVDVVAGDDVDDDRDDVDDDDDGDGEDVDVVENVEDVDDAVNADGNEVGMGGEDVTASTVPAATIVSVSVPLLLGLLVTRIVPFIVLLLLLLLLLLLFLIVALPQFCALVIAALA